MRTTPSRFSACAGMVVDRASEAAPAPARQPVASPATEMSVIEQHYPAVTQALTLLWGRPEMNQYFQKAAGGSTPAPDLTPAAMAELMLLANIHRRICPHQPAKSVEELYGKERRDDTWKLARLRG